MASILIEMAVVPGSVPVANAGGSLTLAAGVNFHAKPGDILQGNIVLKTGNKSLTLNSKGIELSFRGYTYTSITTRRTGNRGRRRLHTSIGGGDLFLITSPPLAPQNEHLFAADATFRFPFQFQVPPGAPATTIINFDHEGLQPEEDPYSRSTQRRHRATVRILYEIKALARVAGLFSSNLAAQIEPAMDPIFPVAPISNGLTAASAAQTLYVPNFLFDCFGSKPVHATATVLKTSLTNGETFEVELAIKNGSDAPIEQCTLALQDAYVITGSGGRLSQVHRFSTIARSVGTINIAPHSDQTIRHSILVSNMTPDITTIGITKTSAILARMKVKGSKKPITLRIPLSCPYAAGIVAVSPVPLVSPISPPAPMQQPLAAWADEQQHPPPAYEQSVPLYEQPAIVSIDRSASAAGLEAAAAASLPALTDQDWEVPSKPPPNQSTADSTPAGPPGGPTDHQHTDSPPGHVDDMGASIVSYDFN